MLSWRGLQVGGQFLLPTRIATLVDSDFRADILIVQAIATATLFRGPVAFWMGGGECPFVNTNHFCPIHRYGYAGVDYPHE